MKLNRILTGTLLALANTLTLPALACEVTLVPLSFGSYDPISSSSTSGTGILDVICPGGTLYNIQLSSGLNTTGFSPRYLERIGGSGQLAYRITIDVAGNFLWDDGTGGFSTVTRTASGATETIYVYGMIPGSQNVAVGDYKDVVNVTIEW